MEQKALRGVRVNNATKPCFFNCCKQHHLGSTSHNAPRSPARSTLMHPDLKSLAGEEDINCVICWLLPNSQTLAAKPIDRMRGNFMQMLCAIP